MLHLNVSRSYIFCSKVSSSQVRASNAEGLTLHSAQRVLGICRQLFACAQTSPQEQLRRYPLWFEIPNYSNYLQLNCFRGNFTTCLHIILYCNSDSQPYLISLCDNMTLVQDLFKIIFCQNQLCHFSLCIIEWLCAYKFIHWSDLTSSKITTIGNKMVETVVGG